MTQYSRSCNLDLTPNLMMAVSSKKRPAAAIALDAPKTPRGKGSLRGLLIHPNHIENFLSGKKTHEVRNFNCRVVKEGDEIFLVATGVKNSSGRSLFKVCARVSFGGNTFVPHEEFSKHRTKHCCTPDDYSQVRKHWSTDKGGCVMWHFKMEEILSPPVYLIPKSGEACWCSSANC